MENTTLSLARRSKESLLVVGRVWWMVTRGGEVCQFPSNPLATYGLVPAASSADQARSGLVAHDLARTARVQFMHAAVPQQRQGKPFYPQDASDGQGEGILTYHAAVPRSWASSAAAYCTSSRATMGRIAGKADRSYCTAALHE